MTERSDIYKYSIVDSAPRTGINTSSIGRQSRQMVVDELHLVEFIILALVG